MQMYHYILFIILTKCILKLVVYALRVLIKDSVNLRTLYRDTFSVLIVIANLQPGYKVSN